LLSLAVGLVLAGCGIAYQGIQIEKLHSELEDVRTIHAFYVDRYEALVEDHEQLLNSTFHLAVKNMELQAENEMLQAELEQLRGG